MNNPTSQRNRWHKVINWTTENGGEGRHNQAFSQTMLGLCLFGSCGAMLYPYSSPGDPLRPYTGWEWRPAVQAL